MDVVRKKINCLTAARIKVGGIGIRIHIDGHQYTLVSAVPLEDTLLIRKNDYPETAVV